MPPAPRRIKRAPAVDLDFARRAAQDYHATKIMADRIDKQLAEQRTNLSTVFDALGEEDHKGNVWVDLGDGRKLKREKRTSRRLSDDVAEAQLEELGLLDKCIKTVEVIDEDAIWALVYNKELDADTVDGFFKTSESWAIKLEGFT